MHNHLKKLLPFSLPDRQRLPLVLLYRKFQEILERNNQILELMADMGEKLGGEYIFDGHYIEELVAKLGDQLFLLISDLAMLTRRKDAGLHRAYARIRAAIEADLHGSYAVQGKELVLPLHALGPEAYELAGDKMAGLGQLCNRLKLPTADGFVVTTQGFRLFLEKNGLLKNAELGVLQYQSGDEASFRASAEKMQHDILKARLPRSLANKILAGFDELMKRTGKPGLRVAVRSSAVGENGEHSFAGQYATLLNISRGELVDGYRRVVASLYAPAAWRYRLQKGYREHETAMAVGCQAMVDGITSGVMHSFAPHIATNSMVINATWGLGEMVMQGEQGSDAIVLDRRPPHEVISTETACKEQRLIPDEKSGTILEETPVQLQKTLSLTPLQIQCLAHAALGIERYYKRPQEIEWSFDVEGNLQILQVKPLRFRGVRLVPVQQVQEVLRSAEVIFRNRGFTVQCGIGVGRICVVAGEEDLETFPDGAILLSHYSSPRYASVMHKARGIITDTGSPTSHMATLAREYRVPTIVSTDVATTLLQDGDEVTLDATHGVVYRGHLSLLDSSEFTDDVAFEDTYEYRLLRRLMDHVSRLHLVDVSSDTISPEKCRTYRDIVQLVQVRAVEALIQRTENANVGDALPIRRLETDIPLGLYVIDAGGGAECSADGNHFRFEQVVSLPLRGLLDGIITLGMWCTDPISVHLGSFMSSFTRTFCTSLSGPREVGRNLAVVTNNYANINLRLGYHFTMIDAVLSGVRDDDYVNFRFWGGVTEPVRRSRRASFIGRVLEHFDFLVEIHGDLVVGRLKKLSLSRMSARMRMLGGLVGYTRQLDACMHSDRDITMHADLFIEAVNRVLGGQYG